MRLADKRRIRQFTRLIAHRHDYRRIANCRIAKPRKQGDARELSASLSANRDAMNLVFGGKRRANDGVANQRESAKCAKVKAVSVVQRHVFINNFRAVRQQFAYCRRQSRHSEDVRPQCKRAGLCGGA